MAFANRLYRLRRRARLSLYALAQKADVDSSYLRRLEDGVQSHPGRDIVLRLGQALVDWCPDITEADVDRLLKAAGYFPLRRKKIEVLGR